MRPSVLALRLAALLLASLAGAPGARATTFYQRPFPTTVGEAPAIVRGKIGMSYPNWVTDAEGNRRIYTFTELEVIEVLKGDVPGKRVMLRALGGEKDGVGLHVPGTAEFSRGEEVVVMVGPANADDSRDVRGMMMGKYNVERDSAGQEYLTGPGINPGNREGVLTAHDERGGSQDADARGQNGTGKWTLSALRELIRDQAKGGPKPAPSLSKAAEIPRVAPSVAPAATRSEQPAPALQPEGEEPASIGWKLWLVLGAALAAVAAALTVLRNQRK